MYSNDMLMTPSMSQASDAPSRRMMVQSSGKKPEEYSDEDMDEEECEEKWFEEEDCYEMKKVRETMMISKSRWRSESSSAQVSKSSKRPKNTNKRGYLSTNNRFSPNHFWSELAKHLAKNDPSLPFLTQSFIYTARNHTEAIAVLTFLSLPFQPRNHSYQSLGGLGLQIDADSDIIVFHKEIKEGEPQINSNILDRPKIL